MDSNIPSQSVFHELEDWTFSAFHHGSIVAKTRDYLEQNIAQPVTIQDLAQALHTSVRTFNRRFAEEGTHPSAPAHQTSDS